ncbi:MAG: ChaN family lipoprotein [Gemmatimonadota bacterium]
MRDLLEAFRTADVVLVGEEHDDAVGHRVELALVGAAHQAVAEPAGRTLVVSLEMFERDVQPVLDEYLAGLITREHFLKSARPWPRYETDYAPTVEYARARGLPVVASNAPRRYVNRVTRLGPDALRDLPPEARSHLAPLPYDPPSTRYRAQWDSLMTAMPRQGGAGEGAARHRRARRPEADPMRFALDAQALWDATMAHSIARALQAHLGALVVHIAGSFHVERGTGIVEHLRRYRPGTRVLTVVIQPSEDIDRFEKAKHSGLADFVILTREEGEPESPV